MRKRLYTHDAAVNKIRKSHPELIAENSKKLENMGLKRLLADVDTKSTRIYTPDQAELFPELESFHDSYETTTLGLPGRRGTRVKLENLTIAQIRSYLAREEKTNNKMTLKDKLRKLYESLENNIMSEAETFGDLIKRSRH